MGLEATCSVRYEEEESSGRARLEDETLLFKGKFHLKIPLQEIRALEVSAGVLTVSFGERRAVFRLGSAEAQKWYRKIRYPRPLLDKLGVQSGHRVSLAGVDDPSFVSQLRDRAEKVFQEPHPDSDLIFLSAEQIADLEQLPSLRDQMVPAGAIWVLWPKGRQRIKEGDVRQAALATKLVDVKVVSFSERLSGLKLMIPRHLR